MKFKLIATVFLLAAWASSIRAEIFSSQKDLAVTLYKYDVAPGNAVVHFVSLNDPEGINSMKHCKSLRDLYVRTDKEIYICASIIYKKNQPKPRWHITD